MPPMRSMRPGMLCLCVAMWTSGLTFMASSRAAHAVAYVDYITKVLRRCFKRNQSNMLRARHRSAGAPRTLPATHALWGDSGLRHGRGGEVRYGGPIRSRTPEIVKFQG